VVKVNNRKVLDGVMEEIGLGGGEHAATRLMVMRAIDKLDRLGLEAVRFLLGTGRKDESGDFTKGAGLEASAIDSLLTMFSISEWASDALAAHPALQSDEAKRSYSRTDSEQAKAEGVFRGIYELTQKSALGIEGLAELRTIWDSVKSAGYDNGRVRIDPSVVRGLEYYTGPVYEVELLIETKDDKGRPVRFGSVGGGGRYDGLVSRFRGEPVPATGFSIGVSRLQAALSLIGKLDTKPAAGPVLVTVFDRDRLADYQTMVAALRNADIRAELYLGNPKHGVGQQLKYADKRNAPCAIIQGPDEKAQGRITIKDLAAGAALASGEKDRDAHLKNQAQAQVTVAESELVAGVRSLLARYGLA
jgi:histidyl-tRNA synthetase